MPGGHLRRRGSRYHVAFRCLDEAKPAKEDDVVLLKKILRAVESYVASLRGMGRREYRREVTRVKNKLSTDMAYEYKVWARREHV